MVVTHLLGWSSKWPAVYEVSVGFPICLKDPIAPRPPRAGSGLLENVTSSQYLWKHSGTVIPSKYTKEWCEWDRKEWCCCDCFIENGHDTDMFICNMINMYLVYIDMLDWSLERLWKHVARFLFPARFESTKNGRDTSFLQCFFS